MSPEKVVLSKKRSLSTETVGGLQEIVVISKRKEKKVFAFLAVIYDVM